MIRIVARTTHALTHTWRRAKESKAHWASELSTTPHGVFWAVKVNYPTPDGRFRMLNKISFPRNNSKQQMEMVVMAVVASEGSRPKGLCTRAVLNIYGKVQKPGCFKPFRFVNTSLTGTFVQKFSLGITHILGHPSVEIKRSLSGAHPPAIAMFCSRSATISSTRRNRRRPPSRWAEDTTNWHCASGADRLRGWSSSYNMIFARAFSGDRAVEGNCLWRWYAWNPRYSEAITNEDWRLSTEKMLKV